MPTVREVAQRPPFKDTGRILDPPEENPNAEQATEPLFAQGLRFVDLFRDKPSTFLVVVEEVVVALEAFLVRAELLPEPFFQPEPKVFEAPENLGQYQSTDTPAVYSPDPEPPFIPPDQILPGEANTGQYASTDTPFTRAPELEPEPFVSAPQVFFVIVEEVVAAVEAIFVRAAIQPEEPFIGEPRIYEAPENTGQYASTDTPFTQDQIQPDPPFVSESRPYVVLLEEIVAVIEPIFVRAAIAADLPVPSKSRVYEAAAQIIERLTVEAKPGEDPFSSRSRLYEVAVDVTSLVFITGFFDQPTVGDTLRAGTVTGAFTDAPTVEGDLDEGSAGGLFFDEPEVEQDG